MLAAGIKAPVPLEELEVHLREEIQQQMESGLNEQKAFEISVQQIGQPESLEGEFRKIERTLMNQTLKIGIGVLGLLAGGALMVPASVQIRQELVVTNGKLGLFLAGWFLLTWSAGLLIQLKGRKRESALEIVELSFMKRSLKTGAGMLGLLTGLTLIIPAAAEAGHEGLVKFNSLCYLVFGVALLITSVVITFCPYKKRRA